MIPLTLRGKRILVTRAAEQAGELCERIRVRGGTPVTLPAVALYPPEDPRPLDRAIRGISSYDWILFTSANAVRFFWERAAANGVTAPPERVLVGSVGPGTSRALSRRGIRVDAEAAKHTAEGLVAALSGAGIRGKRFLFPRALEGRETVPDSVEALGGTVDTVACYRTGLPPRDPDAASAVLSDPPDVCTFASPSAFRNFFVVMGRDAAVSVLRKSRIAVIGEVTARAVEKGKFRVDIVPEKYTLEGMLDAIEAHFASREVPTR